MREKPLKRQSSVSFSPSEDGYFLIVRNYRQWLIKRHRKMLKKTREEHHRMTQIDEINSENVIVVESQPHLNFYYSDQPWDILNDDSARLKSNRSSTHTLDHHSLNSSQQRRRESTTVFENCQKAARLHIFGDSFLPFQFMSQQKGELITN